VRYVGRNRIEWPSITDVHRHRSYTRSASLRTRGGVGRGDLPSSRVSERWLLQSRAMRWLACGRPAGGGATRRARSPRSLWDRIGTGQPHTAGHNRPELAHVSVAAQSHADGAVDRSPRPSQLTPISPSESNSKVPSQSLLILWWQVLGSNQRRRCRRFYRPPPKSTPTRANSAASESVGWNWDQTLGVSQCQPMSPGHPPGVTDDGATAAPALAARHPGDGPLDAPGGPSRSYVQVPHQSTPARHYPPPPEIRATDGPVRSSPQ
jgi:hypothetical protein